MAFRRFLGVGLCCLTVFSMISKAEASVRQKIERVKLTGKSGYLIIEFLTDRVVHFELSSKLPGPEANLPVGTSPMVASAEYPGPSRFLRDGNKMETDALRLEVEPSSLCVQLRDTKTVAISLASARGTSTRIGKDLLSPAAAPVISTDSDKSSVSQASKMGIGLVMCDSPEMNMGTRCCRSTGAITVTRRFRFSMRWEKVSRIMGSS